ncbi:hypothetical protein CFC21_054315 [Triticum aestivum]|uniref:Uncharacterized protein n=3 Tax=Triticum TaxID=4564 RepID=A0A3B6HZK4_WHEAT|nr:hypothetical protein TRIUR3_17293 [Triticum urartu]KAF7045181.1 hypothetical protein CFC21_054315 [Triticum aestivum]
MASKALAALVLLVLLAGGELGRAELAKNVNAMDGASATTTHRHARIGNGFDLLIIQFHALRIGKELLVALILFVWYDIIYQEKVRKNPFP